MAADENGAAWAGDGPDVADRTMVVKADVPCDASFDVDADDADVVDDNELLDVVGGVVLTNVNKLGRVVVVGTGKLQLAPPNASTQRQNALGDVSGLKQTALLPQSRGNKHSLRHTLNSSSHKWSAMGQLSMLLHGVSEQSGPAKCTVFEPGTRSHVHRPVTLLHKPKCEHPFGHSKLSIVPTVVAVVGIGVGPTVVGGAVVVVVVAVGVVVDDVRVTVGGGV